MVDRDAPRESDTVLSVEGLDLPVDVADWVLEEASNVLKGSPALSIVSRLLCLVHELGEVAIGVLGKSSDCQKARISKRERGNAYLPIMSALSLMLGTP